VASRSDLLGTRASESIDEFSCFLLCPAKPPEYWNELYGLVRGLCDLLGRSLGVNVRCFRSVDIVSAGIIHPEIWDSIRKSDIVIADISGLNGNVMFELGVAAAWLDKQRVIIIRQSREEEPRLFDINPARQIDYTVSPLGFERLKNQLGHLIEEGISGAPFEREQFPDLTPPVRLDLRCGTDDHGLWGPSGAQTPAAGKV